MGTEQHRARVGKVRVVGPLEVDAEGICSSVALGKWEKNAALALLMRPGANVDHEAVTFVRKAMGLRFDDWLHTEFVVEEDP